MTTYTIGVSDSTVYARSVEREQTKLYRLWAAMMQRCLSAQYKARRPTYAGCKVDPRFLDYTTFCQWASAQPNFDREGWQLDKDLMATGEPLYSPETCIFLPAEVNGLLAVKYRKLGDLPPGVGHGKAAGRYRAYMSEGNRQRTLGTFDTVPEARAAYLTAKQTQLNAAVKPYAEMLAPDTLARLSVYFNNPS